MIQKPAYTSLGGQALIEGVMMRSPRYYAIALRRPDKKIQLRSARFNAWSARFPILKRPLIRGASMVIESMILGTKALSYSAEIAGTADPVANAQEAIGTSQTASSVAIFLSVALALVFGLGLFVGLPHLLTWGVLRVLGSDAAIDGALFHLIDGVFKIGILLSYVYLIALMPEIFRVFQYHGAEHKTIYAFEGSRPLIPESVSNESALHPRCGTSFLLFLVLISVGVFTVLFPILGVERHLSAMLLKVVLMIPIAGISYEFIKYCAFRMESPLFRALIWPGLQLQRLTTREPDLDQLEIAIVSLKQCLWLEQSETLESDQTFESLGAWEETHRVSPELARVDRYQEA